MILTHFQFRHFYTTVSKEIMHEITWLECKGNAGWPRPLFTYSLHKVGDRLLAALL